MEDLIPSSTVIAHNAVVIRHANELHLTARPNIGHDSPGSEPYEELIEAQRIKREIVSGHKSIRAGEWIIEAGSIGTVQINAMIPGKDVQDIRSTVGKILVEIKQDRTLSCLQSYMTAVRSACSSPSYLSLRGSPSTYSQYITIPAQVGPSQEVADTLEQISIWLNDSSVDSVYIEGDAGSGKTSTMMQLGSLALGESDRSRLGQKFIPMIVKARHLSNVSGVTVEERLWNAVRSSNDFSIQGEPPEPGSMAFWSHYLNDVPWLVLLDGFDELSENERWKTRLWLSDLLTSRPKVKLVVANRQSSIVGESLTEMPSARCLKLLSPTPDNIKGMIRAILGDAGDVLINILWGENGICLVKSPLEATICSLVYKNKGEIPSSRAQLLNLFIDATLREASLQELDRDVDSEMIIAALEAIALSFVEGEAKSQDEAVDTIANLLFSTLNIQNAAVLDAKAQKVVDVLARRSGIFRVEDGLIFWTHALFSNILAARAVVRMTRSSSEHCIEIATEWFERENRTSLWFLLAIWSDCKGFGIRGCRVDITTVVEAVIGADRSGENPRSAESLWRRRAITIVPAFVEGAKVGETLRKRIVDSIVSDLEPFIHYNPCMRLFDQIYDGFNAFEDLVKRPEFIACFDSFLDQASLWVSSGDQVMGKCGARVLGKAGRTRDLVIASCHDAVDQAVVCVGIAYLDERLHAVEIASMKTNMERQNNAN